MLKHFWKQFVGWNICLYMIGNKDQGDFDFGVLKVIICENAIMYVHHVRK